MAGYNYQRYWRHLSLAKNKRSLRREGTTLLLWRRYWKDYIYEEVSELNRFYKVYQHVLRPGTYIVDTIDTGGTEHFHTTFQGTETRYDAQRRLMEKEVNYAEASGFFVVNGVRHYNLVLGMQREWIESVEGEKKWHYFKRDDKEFVNDIRTEGEEWAVKIHP